MDPPAPFVVVMPTPPAPGPAPVDEPEVPPAPVRRASLPELHAPAMATAKRKSPAGTTTRTTRRLREDARDPEIMARDVSKRRTHTKTMAQRVPARPRCH